VELPTRSLIKARGGIGAAVLLCCLTLGAGGAWAVATVARPAGQHPPPIPTLGTMPPATTKQVWAAFSFSDKQRRIYFQCSLDGAPFHDCSSPIRYGPATYVGRVKCKGQPKNARKVKWCRRTITSKRPALSAGAHTFKVRALLGKVAGAPGTYTWTILGGAAPAPGPAPAPASTPASTPASPPASTPSPPAPAPPTGGGSAPVGQPATFSISGNPEGTMYPGAPARRIPLALKNSNSVAIYVTALTVTAASENPECPVEENLLITQSNVTALTPIVIPAGGSVTLPTQGITAPAIQLLDLQSVNQDGCKGSTFILRYSGSAYE